MRGDRPSSLSCNTASITATPHARGSTLLSSHKVVLADGYPACAGIDPLVACVGISRWRLPRMRGDRPRVVLASAYADAATPHARGSTLLTPFVQSGPRGYPACAGIDPEFAASCGEDAGATPHARGSTFSVAHRTLQRHGYPACAGIDPRRQWEAHSTRRLPRMRGDRPVRYKVDSRGRVATPHARGSTLRPDCG